MKKNHQLVRCIQALNTNRTTCIVRPTTILRNYTPNKPSFDGFRDRSQGIPNFINPPLGIPRRITEGDVPKDYRDNNKNEENDWEFQNSMRQGMNQVIDRSKYAQYDQALRYCDYMLEELWSGEESQFYSSPLRNNRGGRSNEKKWSTNGQEVHSQNLFSFIFDEPLLEYLKRLNLSRQSYRYSPTIYFAGVIHLLKAAVYTLRGSYTQALRELSHVMKECFNDEYYNEGQLYSHFNLLKAKIFFFKSDLEMAGAYAARVISHTVRRSSLRLQARNLLAEICLARDHYTRAIKLCDVSLREYGRMETVDTLAIRSRAYHQMFHYEQSLKDSSTVFDLKPSHLLSDLYDTHCSTLLQLEKYEELQEFTIQAVDQMELLQVNMYIPRSTVVCMEVMAHVAKFYLMESQGRYRDALLIFSDHVEPQLPQLSTRTRTLLNLSKMRVLFHMERYHEALDLVNHIRSSDHFDRESACRVALSRAVICAYGGHLVTAHRELEWAQSQILHVPVSYTYSMSDEMIDEQLNHLGKDAHLMLALIMAKALVRGQESIQITPKDSDVSLLDHYFDQAERIAKLLSSKRQLSFIQEQRRKQVDQS